MNRRVSLACISVPLSETASSNGAWSPSGSPVSGSVRRARSSSVSSPSLSSPRLNRTRAATESGLAVRCVEIHLAGHEVDNRVRVLGGDAAFELGAVPAPQLVRVPLTPVRPRRLHGPCRSWSSLQGKAVTGQHPIDGRRRRPHPLLAAAAVSELAMRPVHVAPLVEQRQDLSLLPLQEPVDRVPARAGVIEPAPGSALLPPPRPTPVQLDHRARPVQRPAGIDRIVDQGQQRRLGGPVDTGGNRTAHPQRDFPRSTANSTACSTTVAWSRSTSARNAAASDASWRD